LKKQISPDKNSKKIDYMKAKKYVYFARESMQGLIKIGIAEVLRDRFLRLKAQIPYKMDMELLLIIYGDKSLEKELHRRFKKHRIKGEWFNPHEDILNFIKENKQEEEVAEGDYGTVFVNDQKSPYFGWIGLYDNDEQDEDETKAIVYFDGFPDKYTMMSYDKLVKVNCDYDVEFNKKRRFYSKGRVCLNTD
jgi:hypothetical protein